MNYKVFMKIFFEKPKYFLIYALMMTTFWYVLFIGVANSMFSEHYEKRTPDIEITGKITDIEKDNTLLKELDFSFLNQLRSKSTEIYGLAARNIYLISDTEDKKSHRLYGADEAFIDELRGYLKKGNLPKADRNEALIGSDLAKYLKVGLGDVLNIPAAAGEKDTLPQTYLEPGDNIIYTQKIGTLIRK